MLISSSPQRQQKLYGAVSRVYIVQHASKICYANLRACVLFTAQESVLCDCPLLNYMALKCVSDFFKCI